MITVTRTSNKSTHHYYRIAARVVLSGLGKIVVEADNRAKSLEAGARLICELQEDCYTFFDKRPTCFDGDWSEAGRVGSTLPKGESPFMVCAYLQTESSPSKDMFTFLGPSKRSSLL